MMLLACLNLVFLIYGSDVINAAPFRYCLSHRYFDRFDGVDICFVFLLYTTEQLIMIVLRQEDDRFRCNCFFSSVYRTFNISQISNNRLLNLLPGSRGSILQRHIQPFPMRPSEC